MSDPIKLQVIDKNSKLKSCEPFVMDLEQFNKKTPYYENDLGWLDTQEWANQQIVSNLCGIVDRVSKIASVFVVIGIGGSNNSTRALLSAIGKRKCMEIVYAGNNLSVFEAEKILSYLNGKDFVIDCIAKNFETLEPGVAFRILRNELKQRYGLAGSKQRIICTGTRNSLFHELAKKQGYTFVPFPEDIGGRFTAITPVHLLPMAAGGADINKLIQGASDMATILRNDISCNSIAFKYAEVRNKAYKIGKKIEIFASFEPCLSDFGLWWKQLFAESEGKDGKGIFPVSASFTEELHSLGQIIQDGEDIEIETFLSVKEIEASVAIPNDGIDDGFDYLNSKTLEEINKASEEATIEAHSEKNICICISVPKIDEYYIGALFYFFEYSCYISATMLGVNPFNQPGVEAYKKEMFRILGK